MIDSNPNPSLTIEERIMSQLEKGYARPIRKGVLLAFTTEEAGAVLSAIEQMVKDGKIKQTPGGWIIKL